MFDYVLTAEEREVHFWLDNITRVWKAESSVPKWTTKLRAAGWTETSVSKDANGRDAIVQFEAPEHAVSVRKAAKRPKKELTDEQREVLRERMKAAQLARSKT